MVTSCYHNEGSSDSTPVTSETGVQGKTIKGCKMKILVCNMGKLKLQKICIHFRIRMN